MYMFIEIETVIVQIKQECNWESLDMESHNLAVFINVIDDSITVI